MSTANTFEQEMLALINQERTSRGLNPLQLETRLNDSSEDHSTWMLNSNTFSHTGSGGSSATQRMKDAGFDFDGSWRSGENIAWQSERGAAGISDDVEQLHQSLMDSPGHRANILNPDYEYIGIGIEEGDFNGWDAVMVTQNFATTDGEVIVDNGNAPLPPIEEVVDAEEPATEAPETDVVEAPAAETPEPIATETEEPVVAEEPETDEVETAVPAPETPAPELTEPEVPEVDTVELDETFEETPAEDITGTPNVEEPEVEEIETPETDVTETEVPVTETPDFDMTDAETPDYGCFDVEEFLTEINDFVNNLMAMVDDFWLPETEMQPVSEDDFMLTGEHCDVPATMPETTADMGTEQFDGMFFNPDFFGDACMMNFA